MRWLAISVVVHALVLAWLLPQRQVAMHVLPQVQPAARVVEPVPIEVIAMSSGEGAPSTASARAAVTPRRARDAWQQVVVSQERTQIGQGQGQGQGQGGTGTGTGIGFGNGGGIGELARDIPAPPAPIVEAVSKARPAVLVWPTRDEDVEDEADLFVARITVDEDGSVVGARMVKTRPGARGDDAANAIWRFRYLPALDDRGMPIRSTFQQPFQVR